MSIILMYAVVGKDCEIPMKLKTKSVDKSLMTWNDNKCSFANAVEIRTPIPELFLDSNKMLTMLSAPAEQSDWLQWPCQGKNQNRS